MGGPATEKPLLLSCPADLEDRWQPSGLTVGGEGVGGVRVKGQGVTLALYKGTWLKR